LLIAGYTIYDTQSDGQAHVIDRVALEAIRSEWARTDLDVLGTRESYRLRREHLKEGTGLNAPFVLKNGRGLTATGFDATASDTLIGGAGLDWFFADKKRDTTDTEVGEQID